VRGDLILYMGSPRCRCRVRGLSLASRRERKDSFQDLPIAAIGRGSFGLEKREARNGARHSGKGHLDGCAGTCLLSGHVP